MSRHPCVHNPCKGCDKLESRDNLACQQDELVGLESQMVDHMSELVARGAQVDSKSSNMGPTPTESTPPPQEWRSEDLRHAQIEDPDLRPILTWMESSKARPVWNEVSPHSESTKTYWSQWKSLQLRDGVLYQCSVSWQLLALQSMRKLIFAQLHSLPTAGHFGVSRTLARIRERFYWSRCHQDVCRWCRD